MKKIIIRNFKFEGKELDFSKTYDFRILETKKRNLDFIDEYSLYDEETNFEIYQGEELKCKFSRKDYLNDNVDLTLKQGASICEVLTIEENIVKTLKNEKEDSKNLVVSRLVKIQY